MEFVRSKRHLMSQVGAASDHKPWIPSHWWTLLLGHCRIVGVGVVHSVSNDCTKPGDGLVNMSYTHQRLFCGFVGTTVTVIDTQEC